MGQAKARGTYEERRAQAIAHFISGLFEEESDGPEKAIESYRKVLAIDPSYTELAIKVAHDFLRRGDPEKQLIFCFIILNFISIRFSN